MDLSAAIEQAAVDRLTRSVDYPFALFTHREDFQPAPLILAAGAEDDGGYEYNDAEVRELLNAAEASADLSILATEPHDPEAQLYVDILLSASATIESAKACLRARDEATASGSDFEGPPEAELHEILEGGVSGLAAIRGIKFRAHLAWAEVGARTMPQITLRGSRIDVSAEIFGGATGELWWYHPSFHCSRLCARWRTTWSWDRIGSLTVRGVRFEAEAHALATVNEAKVTVNGVFDRLRLDYRILDKIRLEGIANRKLKERTLIAVDAAELVATMPVLRSRFRPHSIELPDSDRRLVANITLAQLTG